MSWCCNGPSRRGGGWLGCLRAGNVVAADFWIILALILIGINIEVNGDPFTLTDGKAVNPVLSEDLEGYLLGILLFCLKDVLLVVPGIACAL